MLLIMKGCIDLLYSIGCACCNRQACCHHTTYMNSVRPFTSQKHQHSITLNLYITSNTPKGCYTAL